MDHKILTTNILHKNYKHCMTKTFGQYREGGGLSPGARRNPLHLFLTELHVKMLHKYVCTQQ